MDEAVDWLYVLREACNAYSTQLIWALALVTAYACLWMWRQLSQLEAARHHAQMVCSRPVFSNPPPVLLNNPSAPLYSHHSPFITDFKNRYAAKYLPEDKRTASSDDDLTRRHDEHPYRHCVVPRAQWHRHVSRSKGHSSSRHRRRPSPPSRPSPQPRRNSPPRAAANKQCPENSDAQREHRNTDQNHHHCQQRQACHDQQEQGEVPKCPAYPSAEDWCGFAPAGGDVMLIRGKLFQGPSSSPPPALDDLTSMASAVSSRNQASSHDRSPTDFSSSPDSRSPPFQQPHGQHHPHRHASPGKRERGRHATRDTGTAMSQHTDNAWCTSAPSAQSAPKDVQRAEHGHQVQKDPAFASQACPQHGVQARGTTASQPSLQHTKSALSTDTQREQRRWPQLITISDTETQAGNLRAAVTQAAALLTPSRQSSADLQAAEEKATARHAAAVAAASNQAIDKMAIAKETARISAAVNQGSSEHVVPVQTSASLQIPVPFESPAPSQTQTPAPSQTALQQKEAGDFSVSTSTAAPGAGTSSGAVCAPGTSSVAGRASGTSTVSSKTGSASIPKVKGPSIYKRLSELLHAEQDASSVQEMNSTPGLKTVTTLSSQQNLHTSVTSVKSQSTCPSMDTQARQTVDVLSFSQSVRVENHTFSLPTEMSSSSHGHLISARSMSADSHTDDSMLTRSHQSLAQDGTTEAGQGSHWVRRVESSVAQEASRRLARLRRRLENSIEQIRSQADDDHLCPQLTATRDRTRKVTNADSTADTGKQLVCVTDRQLPRATAPQSANASSASERSFEDKPDGDVSVLPRPIDTESFSQTSLGSREDRASQSRSSVLSAAHASLDSREKDIPAQESRVSARSRAKSNQSEQSAHSDTGTNISQSRQSACSVNHKATRSGCEWLAPWRAPADSQSKTSRAGRSSRDVDSMLSSPGPSQHKSSDQSLGSRALSTSGQNPQTPHPVVGARQSQEFLKKLPAASSETCSRSSRGNISECASSRATTSTRESAVYRASDTDSQDQQDDSSMNPPSDVHEVCAETQTKETQSGKEAAGRQDDLADRVINLTSQGQQLFKNLDKTFITLFKDSLSRKSSKPETVQQSGGDIARATTSNWASALLAPPPRKKLKNRSPRRYTLDNSALCQMMIPALKLKAAQECRSPLPDQPEGASVKEESVTSVLQQGISSGTRLTESRTGEEQEASASAGEKEAQEAGESTVAESAGSALGGLDWEHDVSTAPPMPTDILSKLKPSTKYTSRRTLRHLRYIQQEYEYKDTQKKTSLTPRFDTADSTGASLISGKSGTSKEGQTEGASESQTVRERENTARSRARSRRLPERSAADQGPKLPPPVPPKTRTVNLLSAANVDTTQPVSPERTAEPPFNSFSPIVPSTHLSGGFCATKWTEDHSMPAGTGGAYAVSCSKPTPVSREAVSHLSRTGAAFTRREESGDRATWESRESAASRLQEDTDTTRTESLKETASALTFYARDDLDRPEVNPSGEPTAGRERTNSRLQTHTAELDTTDVTRPKTVRPRADSTSPVRIHIKKFEEAIVNANTTKVSETAQVLTRAASASPIRANIIMFEEKARRVNSCRDRLPVSPATRRRRNWSGAGVHIGDHSRDDETAV